MYIMIFYVHKFYSDYSVKVKTQNMSKIRSTGYTHNILVERNAMPVWL